MASLDTDFWLMQLKPDKQMAKSLVTRNEAMLACLRLAKKCAEAHCHVMITGETGVGKYLVASYLHRHSPRESRPLMTMQCSEFREGEIRNVLLGAGVAPGIPPAPDGILYQAAGGTLILRGVEQLTGEMQKELLAILHDYARKDTLGNGGETGLGRDLGVRLISTSSAGLGSLASSGLFLEDLFFALGEVTLRVPPLRDRREDVEYLASLALEAAHRNGAPLRTLSSSAKTFLRHYAFPGNISELFRMMERAARPEGGECVYVEDFGVLGTAPGGVEEGELLSLAELEKRQINLALLHTGWRRNAAARILHVTETMLNRKIRIYGLELDA